MANCGRTLELLRKHGVRRARFQDGKLAFVEFLPPAAKAPSERQAFPAHGQDERPDDIDLATRPERAPLPVWEDQDVGPGSTQ